MKTEVKVIDVKHSVFDNETEAILYVFKDTEGVDDEYVFSLPVYTFSVSVKTEKELEDFMRTYSLFDSVRRQRLTDEMKKAMIDL